MNKNKRIRLIALYLPQFHPIPENDEWWGKGFTEWTNVGKAKPLFRGHYQPKVPADLGYYDLRLEETRIAQAEMAKEYGIEGFCYWHYWFGNGKRILEKPINEVLLTGKPDFPFSFCWANHSWKAKTWRYDTKDKILLEQQYPGKDDYINHFYSLLPAFMDERYINVDEKPIFGVYAPNDIPNAKEFIDIWNNLAIKNGLKGIYFIAYSTLMKDISKHLNNGYNAVSIDYLHEFFHSRNLIKKIQQEIFMEAKIRPKTLSYKKYVEFILNNVIIENNVFPCLLPNYDHTPRSLYRGLVLDKSDPEKWYILLSHIFNKMKTNDNEENIILIKSWNEWGEGNYLEPDLKFGREYLNAIKKALNEYETDNINPSFSKAKHR
jgi:hypothetical protein